MRLAVDLEAQGAQALLDAVDIYRVISDFSLIEWKNLELPSLVL